MAGRAVGGKNCIAIQNCIATERLGIWAARRARRWAMGWACSRHAAGAGARGHSAGVSGARGQARGARQVGALGRARQVSGRARQGAASPRARRVGCLWAVHSVHSACFRSGLTRYCS